MALGATTLSITTIGRTALGITIKNATHSIMTLNTLMLSVIYAECRKYANCHCDECQYIEFRGAIWLAVTSLPWNRRATTMRGIDFLMGRNGSGPISPKPTMMRKQPVVVTTLGRLLSQMMPQIGAELPEEENRRIYYH